MKAEANQPEVNASPSSGDVGVRARATGWPNRIVNEYTCVVFCLLYAALTTWLLVYIFTRTGPLNVIKLFFVAAFSIMALTNAFNLYCAFGTLLKPAPRHQRMYSAVPLESGIVGTVGLLVCARNEHDPYGKLQEVLRDLHTNQPADESLRNRYRFVISILSDSTEAPQPGDPSPMQEEKDAIARMAVERPEYEFRFCRRKDTGAYGKYGNMVGWLRSTNADATDYYITYDYDSRMTGGAVWALLTELEMYPQLFSVQGTMAIERQEGMSQFAIDTAQARDEFSCTALIAVLGGNWGHQIAVRTRLAQEMIRQFPPERYSEAEVLSHDCLEAVWASTMGHESGIIELRPQDSLEQTCEDLTHCLIQVAF